MLALATLKNTTNKNPEKKPQPPASSYTSWPLHPLSDSLLFSFTVSLRFFCFNFLWSFYSTLISVLSSSFLSLSGHFTGAAELCAFGALCGHLYRWIPKPRRQTLHPRAVPSKACGNDWVCASCWAGKIGAILLQPPIPAPSISRGPLRPKMAAAVTAVVPSPAISLAAGCLDGWALGCHVRPPLKDSNPK